MGELDGRTAFITGGARGQGRAHAVALATEGANIVLTDICGPVETAPQVPATKEDLDETVALVEALGRKCLAIHADVRDAEQMNEAAKAALGEFGQIDILIANAGILRMGRFDELTPEQFNVHMDVLFYGVVNSVRAVLPHMQQRGYGRIIATGSGASRGGIGNLSPYVAAKWAISGFCKSLAIEVGAQGINVNVVAPYTANTMLNWNENMYQYCAPDNPTKEETIKAFRSGMELPIDYIEPEDVANAAAFLVSDKARYITGIVLDVMAGYSAHNSA